MSIEKSVSKFLLSKRQPKDIFLLFLLAMLLLWLPTYLKQELNLFELGLYLPGIDAVSQGQVPFRDFFHLRGPFELYLPTLFMKVFGFRLDVLATYFYVGTIMTMLASIIIAIELIEQRILLYSFVLILITRTFPRVVFTCWGGMRYAWGLLAIWCLIRFLKSNRSGWLLAGGCLTAIGMLTSIEIGVIVFAAFIIMIILNQEYQRRLWVFFLGFLLVILPYSTYLICQHALMPYLQGQWIVVTHMQQTFLELDRVPNTIPKFLHAILIPTDKSFYQMTPMYCYIFFFTLYFWRILKKNINVLDHAAFLVAAYGLISFLTGFRKIEFVEYEMALQPEKIVLFYLLGQLVAEIPKKISTAKWLSGFLILVVFISSVIYSVGRFNTRFYKSSWVYQLIGNKKNGKTELINGALETPIDLPRIKNMIIPVWQAQDLDELQSFVDQHVPAHEAIWMYPELGSLHFLLNRPWVGRFPMVTLSWMDDQGFADYEATLEQNPPNFAIVKKEKNFYFDKTYFLVEGNRIKQDHLMQFLSQHYVIKEQTPSYLIYQRVH